MLRKKCLVVLLVLVMLAVVGVSFADDSGYVDYKGNTIKLVLMGSSDGEWSQLVRDSLPFQLPEEGEVILLRCSKLGSQVKPDELELIVNEFKLYNKRTDRYLLPVSAITVEVTSSTFDLLFYENTQVYPEDYSLFCEGEEYTFENFSSYPYPTNVLREPGEVLPTMPPEGGFLKESRPEYCEPAENMIKAIDQGQMTILEGDPQYAEKLAVIVFSSQDVVWKTTFEEEDQIAALLPQDRLAKSWDEADTVILIRRETMVVGNYGARGSARRVDTIVTVVDKKLNARYRSILAFSSDPPESIRTNSAYASGAEGNYEYEKAIEQIAEQLVETGE